MTTLYVGAEKLSGRRKVFYAKDEPTEATHGTLYSYVIGPFYTVRGAQFMRDNANNPHCQCVSDAERLARKRVKS
jgi:hypothetical protein